jgi:hypothetical protein
MGRGTCYICKSCLLDRAVFGHNTVAITTLRWARGFLQICLRLECALPPICLWRQWYALHKLAEFPIVLRPERLPQLDNDDEAALCMSNAD